MSALFRDTQAGSDARPKLANGTHRDHDARGDAATDPAAEARVVEAQDAGEPDPGSITVWLTQLKWGDPEAVRALWERYSTALVALARAKLKRQSRRVTDEEDLALVAFEHACRAIARMDQSPSNRMEFWRLLVLITTRKAIDRIRRSRRQKRAGEPLEASATGDDSQASVALENAVANDPDPAIAAILNEEYHALLNRLESDDLRSIVLLRLEGHTTPEIAMRMHCSVATIERRLLQIRRTWQAT